MIKRVFFIIMIVFFGIFFEVVDMLINFLLVWFVNGREFIIFNNYN